MQADKLVGTWVTESGSRLYGVTYDGLLADAAANGGLGAAPMRVRSPCRP